jgi:hypothetical protein
MRNITKLLLSAAALAQAGAAAAQTSQNSCPDDVEAPEISRTDVATVSRPTPTSAVVQIEVDAALSDGRPLTYSFSGGGGGALVSQGASATWTVEGAGTFTATIAVSAPSYPCSSFASVTFTVEPQAADEEPGEGE